MPKFHPKELNASLRSVAGWLAPLVRTLFGLRVRGLEKLPKSGPYVLVANHVTNVDPLAVAYFVYVYLKRAPHFLAKESLFRIPFVGKILLNAGQIPVYRSSGNRNDEPLRVAHEYLELPDCPLGRTGHPASLRQQVPPRILEEGGHSGR
ncbi:MAG: hypothetical protein RJA26_1021 [Actinomycetota bacterium]